ncbi:hypothetical protein GO685_02200 [Wolbachia endosymbiont of Madathamugadia hiepei]|uniref:hypothetical protein n=1 Tax=Wolbachia endosymbiont of Madathamugadia hiepei TaxID=1241303 RepID=UPI00158A8731|nr:hypothetical protein [Wolbachia endosymbiont of Madathamugadia hiepei]NUX01323.1 hypothetical protein [Wolbachia endosymbiont of Madathamugadia hiepei]
MSIKVMLKCTIFMENWIPVSEHWDNTVCYANYLLIAMCVQLRVKHWNDKKGATYMTPLLLQYLPDPLYVKNKQFSHSNSRSNFIWFFMSDYIIKIILRKKREGRIKDS